MVFTIFLIKYMQSWWAFKKSCWSQT